MIYCHDLRYYCYFRFLQSRLKDIPVDVTLDILDDYDKNKDKLQNYEAMEKQVNNLQQQLRHNSYFAETSFRKV